MLLFQDNFRRYPTPKDMTNEAGYGGQWVTHIGALHTAAAFVEADSALKKVRKDRVLVIQTDSNGASPMAQFDGMSHSAVCFSFILGVTGSATIPMDFVIFDTPVTPIGTGTIAQISTYHGIHLKSTATGELTVTHKIATNNTTGSGNELILATLPSLKPGTIYHIEGKVDHTNPLARIILYVNGAKVLDMTYDRDRVDNGYQDKAFRNVILGGMSTSPSVQTRYRDLTIYTDDATTTFPMGPISFPTKDPTAHPGMVIDVGATDATNVTIAPGAEVTGTFSELEASGQPILGAYVELRHLASGGLLRSELDVEILDAANNVIKTLYSVTPSGLMGSQPKVRLDGLTAAQAAGLKYRISARS